MTSLLRHIPAAIRLRSRRWLVNRRVKSLASQVRAAAGARPHAERPVALFNASTRLVGISLNTAFSLLTRLGLEMAGVPVVQFACQAGMSRCVLGTDRDDPAKDPPCQPCIAQSRVLFDDGQTTWFTYAEDSELAEALKTLTLAELEEFTYPLDPGQKSLLQIPLGRLVLPALRWVLRRHHLADDLSTRQLFRQYILSARRVAGEFSRFVDWTSPRLLVVFNGQFFPEATAAWVARQRGIEVVTHEVGLQPFSAFFTRGEATAYPLDIPADFALTPEQDAHLDEYLNRRSQGQFSMAGIRFWPEMKGLGEDLLQRLSQYKQVVPIFTNVIFDTSQPHSNVLFPDMFAWLEVVLETARKHPETLFVLRAHPDETRPGKASRESVAQWVEQNRADQLPNLVFIESGQALSSYELIRRAKFVMIYNSTIGLEASILGSAVLCAGRARFTQLPTVFFPVTQAEYVQQLETFLGMEEIPIPLEFKTNARRFLYYQLFYSSLPFADYLEEDGIWPGFVRLKEFAPSLLTAEVSPALRAVLDGLLQGGDFMLREEGG